jgi:hypothetical protein
VTAATPWFRQPRASGAVVYNFEAVGCQFQKYALRDD